MNPDSFNIPCVTCKYSLRSTLRPTEKQDFYYCYKCKACYKYIMTWDIFGNVTESLDLVSPGNKEFSKADDDGVRYDMQDLNKELSKYDIGIDPAAPNTDHTLQEFHTEYPAEWIENDLVMRVPPPKIEHHKIPDFEEELKIIEKSKTVKEFLKNSLYLEKPYDKD